MKRFLTRLLAWMFAVSLCLSVFCFVLESVAFDGDFHYESVDLDYISSKLSIDEEQVKSAIDTTVLYIKGGSDDMQVDLGEGKYLFNERELLHMVDVQNLFALCDFAKFVCIGACMLLFIVIFALNGFYSFKYIARGCVLGMLSMMGLVAIVGIWYMIDFSGFWTAFHEIAFTNDLWLMMPDDALIIFYTLDFFTIIVRRIIERLAVIYGAIFVGAFIGWVILPGEKGRKFGKKNFGN